MDVDIPEGMNSTAFDNYADDHIEEAAENDEDLSFIEEEEGLFLVVYSLLYS